MPEGAQHGPGRDFGRFSGFELSGTGGFIGKDRRRLCVAANAGMYFEGTGRRATVLTSSTTS